MPDTAIIHDLSAFRGGDSPKKADAEERIRAVLAKPYLDYEEAALVLNIKVKTLRNMKYRREITYTHFGKKVYFPKKTILAELRVNTVASPKIAAERTKREAG